MSMVRRTDVEFSADGGVTLRAWLFEPDQPGPRVSRFAHASGAAVAWFQRHLMDGTSR
jgi:hypothetical protein